MPLTVTNREPPLTPATAGHSVNQPETTSRRIRPLMTRTEMMFCLIMPKVFPLILTA